MNRREERFSLSEVFVEFPIICNKIQQDQDLVEHDVASGSAVQDQEPADQPQLFFRQHTQHNIIRNRSYN
jgi:hypothetical protein